MAGARVVPLHYNSTQEQLDFMLNRINGVLFPGGDTNMQINEQLTNNTFTQNAYYIVQYAQNQTKLGKKFPIWGTCQGFQLLNYILSNFSANIVAALKVPDVNVSHNLQPQNFDHSVLYINQSVAYYMNLFGGKPLYYNHHYAVFDKDFRDNQFLSSLLYVTGFSYNDAGEQFIASIEGKTYPIYGSQYHPEKNNFEWKVNSNHDIQSIKFSQQQSNFFVQFARQNLNQFDNAQQLSQYLIYNYNTTVIPSSSFMMLYFFQENDPNPRIYTQPSDSDFPQYPPQNYSYIAGSYIQYIEMAGARVVPVHYNSTFEQLDFIFDRINGILFTGGDTNIYFNEQKNNNTFTTNAAYLIQKAINSTKKGKPYPIWGTCQGFKLISYVISDFNNTIAITLNPSDSNVTHNLIPYNLNETKLYANQSVGFYANLFGGKPLFYNHHYAILKDSLINDNNLNEMFIISGFSDTDNKIRFIASIEGKQYPIYGVQYHPEKNSFEWKVNANHDIASVKFAQHLANFFVELARENNNKFDNQQQENSYLIYNYNTTIVQNQSFMMIYFFNEINPDF